MEKGEQSYATGWHGQLYLEFTHRTGETLLSHSQVQAPLKIQRPFYPEGRSLCQGVLLHTAGGIVGGDRLSYRIHLQPHSQVQLTTAAATKVYRSNGPEAHQQTHIQVASGAWLEWLPQETIVFDGAVYHQEVQIHLAVEAAWLGWEVVRLGRSARGERFQSGRWRSRIQVWQGDRLLWVDPQEIQGGSDRLTSLHGLAHCPVIGSLALIGPTIPPDTLAAVRAIACTPPIASPARPPADVGVTQLMAGLLCRYRGHSTAEARHWFGQIWPILRSLYSDRPPSRPRVW